MVSIFNRSKVKRSIELDKITHITYSETSSQFIVHVPSQYDYNLRTLERDEFILYLIYLKEKIGLPPMKIWMRPEINLEQFTKTDKMKNTVCPSEEPKEYNTQQFLDFLKLKDMKIKETAEQTETLISKDGKKLTENDFEVIRMLGKGAFGKVILTRKKDDGELYAIKILNKSDLIKKD